MSDNDCVSRAWLLAEYDRQHEGPAGKARKLIEDAPAVQHEMRAKEYEKAFQRITYEDAETYRAWWEAIHDEDWGRAVAIVEAWAREHTERSEE